MEAVRVLVIGGNAKDRELMAEILSRDEEIKLIGGIRGGRDAIRQVLELKPDIVAMLIEMPFLEGFETIEEIMATRAVPILVVSSDEKAVASAISKGALDLIATPGTDFIRGREFTEKIKLLSKIKVITHIGGKRPREVVQRKASDRGGGGEIVAIASSTGGPEALSIVLSGLPEGFPCPIVVSQHMSDGFVPGLVEWLRKLTQPQVKLATEGEVLAAGTVYFSPSERHMRINPERRIEFVRIGPKDIYHPSCDLLLSSVADVYGPKSVGIILTGMGSDGALGMQRIKEAGGITMAQDEKTSVVFGMPKAAIERGCIDQILPLEEIGREMVRLFPVGRRDG